MTGFLSVTLTALGGLEGFLRLFPPADIQDYLGDASPQVGPFVPDPEGSGVTYPDYAALRADNPRSLGERNGQSWEDLDGAWLFLGTSFVHMRGAFHDTVAELVPTQTCFKLDRREPLFVRMAQVQVLLQAGLRPGRVVLTLMPVDIGLLLDHDLASISASRRGAIVLKPRPPPAPFTPLVPGSRLALTAWVRAGLQRPHRELERHHLYDVVPDHLRRDLRHLFARLADVTGQHGVPVTIVFIPTTRQAQGKARFEFQEVVGALAREAGLGTVDPRNMFLGAEDPARLYIHDGHLSPQGYRLLARELMRALGQETRIVGPEDRDS